MSEQIREQVSAFLDGELPGNETELLLKRMTRDSELRECFGRYALIAEVIRDPKTRPLSRDFTQRVNRLIDGEPAIEVKLNAVSRARHWWRPIAGAAVAAGVAAIAVVALERRTDVAPAVASSGAPPAASAPAVMVNANFSNAAGKSKEAVSYTVPAAGPESAAVLPAARLTNYVFAHSKYSSALGQRNVLSGLIAEQPMEAGAGVPGAGLPAAGEPVPASALLPPQP
jgi:negative regulator of sigma E activity